MMMLDLPSVFADTCSNTPAAPLLESVTYPFNDGHNRRVLLFNGIEYERIDGQFYEMRRFEDDTIETYLSRLYEVQKQEDRTPYDYVVIDNDSSIERKIAETLDSHERVKFFCKLPDWFKVPTPVGNYNPDWAIVKEDDAKLYLVKETKSTHTRHKLRGNEAPKFDCGKKHFEALGGEFGVATNIHEILEGEPN